MPLHTNRRLLVALTIPFTITFLVLLWSSVAGTGNPGARFFDLLFHDRVFQLVMFDFTFFFIWVFLWMIDRGREKGRMVFPWLIVGLLCATLMIHLFIATEKQTHA